ncbi:MULTISPECIES: biosynthetic-type acetolactate synthase large subunit [unclassified Methanoculleus]|uniref:biosynthetic-type acetolactate synthase large subunit n=1 Tax=unclassified Methanoculleus TaxID=2619537 RepID=UPI002600B225|nr:MULTISPECIES: biosynthetic-type acetolactate synthase large subunit [unclassified Methanoculleus]MCK9317771.1 biosynthetic-type acetolactate synthase large subunit [Methanoculleus sp.]MDD2254853.1 biosynthetic-type acetolactate synthase large subunit [Methanoculleus sp.]MDD2788015.1 biosynthetic-type acetolactate synthase large subunit [Methanoculleus sp.]MDD3217125.1 biosynthetic-type acetolactate synthase large subunit [Methanoculleus sp.]MDD4314660.1 biosynthetic-type acetolactate syntha
MKTGARTLIEALQREGVDTIFGYPGGVVLPIYDELYDSSVRHILVRHEQAAAHAADGYARASGRVGVCLATSGPGACNLVTGIATAYMDSIPIVALTGQVPTALLGNDAFQESDITGITMPVTKHNYLVKDVADLDRVVQEAFYVARTGRPGPVLVDLPKDVTTSVAKSNPVPEAVSLRGYQPTYQGHVRQIDKALDLITGAERPLIYAGGGVVLSGASAELLEFAETAAVPVTTTLMGLGAVPGDHPLNLGMLGMHGTQSANYAVTECDLLLAIGARFDDRVTGKIETFAPNATVIHIDIDPAEIGKNKKVDVPIVGDVKAVLQALLRRMQKRGDTANWVSRINAWKAQYPLRFRDDDHLRPQYVIRELSDVLKGEGIITSEVGQNQMWTALYYRFTKPRTWITSGGLGTMGYGFPAAIGAHYACPDVPVVDVAGDGSFQMNIQELGTVAQYDIPVKVVILNNMYLGMVRQWQELFYDRRYSYTELPPVDFVKIANAYGVDGIRVDAKDGVREAIETALATDGPFVLDFRVEREENVFPMVPAGAAINEMIGVRQ